MPNTKRGSARPPSWVDVAVARVGGQTKAALLLQCSAGTIHRMKAEGRMTTDTPEARERVKRLAEASRVSIVGLLGFADVAVPEHELRRARRGRPRAAPRPLAVREARAASAG